MKLDRLPRYADMNPVCVLFIDLEGLDFLLDELPMNDGFTRELRKLREKVGLELAREDDLTK